MLSKFANNGQRNSTLRAQMEATEGEKVVCMKCRTFSDQAILLLCNNCNNRFHEHCLDAPLEQSSNKGTCECCNKEIDDGLGERVHKLPIKIKSRFGELCWMNLKSYGYWPCLIYDPRLTSGPPRNKANRWLGTKFLIYYLEFDGERDEAPFALVREERIIGWCAGLSRDFHLCTPRSFRGRNGTRFEKFQMAMSKLPLSQEAVSKYLEGQMAADDSKRSENISTRGEDRGSMFDTEEEMKSEDIEDQTDVGDVKSNENISRPGEVSVSTFEAEEQTKLEDIGDSTALEDSKSNEHISTWGEDHGSTLATEEQTNSDGIEDQTALEDSKCNENISGHGEVPVSTFKTELQTKLEDLDDQTVREDSKSYEHISGPEEEVRVPTFETEEQINLEDLEDQVAPEGSNSVENNLIKGEVCVSIFDNQEQRNSEDAISGRERKRRRNSAESDNYRERLPVALPQRSTSQTGHMLQNDAFAGGSLDRPIKLDEDKNCEYTSAHMEGSHVGNSHYMQGDASLLRALQDYGAEIPDLEMYCQIVAAAVEDGVPKEVLVGYIILPSRKHSTFENAREMIDNTIDAQLLFRNWRFCHPKLGPISIKMEDKIGPMLSHLNKGFIGATIPDGSIDKPAQVTIIEAPALP